MEWIFFLMLGRGNTHTADVLVDANGEVSVDALKLYQGGYRSFRLILR